MHSLQFVSPEKFQDVHFSFAFRLKFFDGYPTINGFYIKIIFVVGVDFTRLVLVVILFVDGNSEYFVCFAIELTPGCGVGTKAADKIPDNFTLLSPVDLAGFFKNFRCMLDW